MKKYLTIIASLAMALITTANAADIEIYTASYCSECKTAKAYLTTNDIAFDEHDVEHDLMQRKVFYARGGKGVPLLFVKGQMMHGFEAQQFESLRGSTGSP